MSANASSPSSYREKWRYPPPRQTRTGLLRCILLTSTIFVLGFCGTILLLRYFAKELHGKACEGCAENVRLKNERLRSDGCQKVCTTEECMRTAADMISRMDTNIDPCKNFYRFSCGKYDKISMGTPRRQQFMYDGAERITEVLRGIIENIPKHLPETVPGYSSSKARNLYDSCISFRSTEIMAIPTIMKHLDYLGIRNWPYLDSDYQFINPDLDEVIARLIPYGANYFFAVEVEVDEEKETDENDMETTTTINITSLIAPVIVVQTAKKSLFLGPGSAEEELVPTMSDILNYFGMSEDLINSTIEEVFSFDRALQHIRQISRRRIQKCISNMKISCAAYEFDCDKESDLEMERWCMVAKRVMDTIGMREKHPNFTLYLKDKFYFEDLRALIDSTSNRTIAHGLALNILTTTMNFMDYRFRRMAGHSTVSGLMEKLQEDRWLFCIILLLGTYPALLGTAFYTSKYSGELQREGDEIYGDIQKYLIAHTRNMTWVDPEALESLEQQLWRISLSLSPYLPYISDSSELDKFYKKLQITDESFLSNILEIKRFSYLSQLLYHENAEMLRNSKKIEFGFNPKYQGEVIVLDFSAYIYPFITKGRPRYSNLGFFGSLIAHEFSHAVEIFFRDRANMSASFKQTLREKKECLINQYSEYEMALIKAKVNGSLTLHENMADYFSVRPTYEAFKRYQEEYGMEKTLPGLHFNIEQLFFISFGQWWCENNTPETMKLYLDDTHSPGTYRVLGMMKNFEPFSQAFNCPLGSPMNPVEKCTF